jgi:putative DNA primase/helicase
VLDEFGFDRDGGVSKSTTVSAILAACVRRVLPMCPAFLIDAPKQSNGKTLLADLIATVPTDRGAGATQWPNELAEQRKTITSILTAGDLVVNFDNVTASIGGPAICGVMTAQASFKDRQLGKTLMLELPTNSLWIFTGNNMTVKDDMASRVLRIRLDAKVENPRLRTFKRKDLLAYVRERRGLLIHAALTILKAYNVAGRPLVDINGKAFKVPSRFNVFGDWIVASLVWLGQPDPLQSQESIVEDDPVRETQQTILALWRDLHGFDRWVTAKELRRVWGEEKKESLADAIDEIEAGGTSQNATASKLKTFEGSIINDMKLVSRPAKPNRPKAWRLVDCRFDFLDIDP